ncbi:hypothetical protein PR048_030733 [Dryococelus australis]|uniref:Dol-P-Glc:Glc(2)Man(9)GlcNAc(2)-PP-Dol alpha-1,2-glucosyltransferase n=1 Tax=Dryococelus australis TaxID=614101 RepID=A0ABQ9GA71_9NEOP|nr:hypothetical protein PR048_030733 [Dryococelus australis]
MTNQQFNTLVFGVFIGVTVTLFNVIYEVQQEPYLDEVFHVPQAQKYCSWLFYEWDSKITTLPGLYLFSVGVLTPITALMRRDMCSVFSLRFINVIGSVANFYILYSIHNKLYPSRKELNLMSSVNLAIFPVLYFFTFLYYTDVLSTLLVLLMYLLHLHKRRSLSAITGFLAVVTRQTNIIWVGFVLLDTIFSILKETIVLQKKKPSSSSDKRLLYQKFLQNAVMYPWGETVPFAALVKKLFQETVLLCAVCLSFVCFMGWNRGIVVGDRTAHQAVLHFSQIHYFSLFSCCFGFPFLLANTRSVVNWVKMHKREAVTFLAVSLLVVHFNTLAHPYLLADNRHYTFYIWKRVYERYLLSRYLLIPVYLFGVIASFEALRNASPAMRMSLTLCVVLSLVPQKLLEFRYFILPYLFLRLHISRVVWWQLLLEFVVYAAVNAATIYLFISRTFTWPHSDQLHRFITGSG